MDPKALKKLKAEWEKKLSKDGLGDIEDSKGRLKKWHSRWFMHPSVGHDLVATAEYYRTAEQFLNSHVFKNVFEKNIWLLHSEAVSFREISRRVKLNRGVVSEIVKRLRSEMRTWARLESLDDEF